MVGLDDASLISIVREELRSILKIKAEPVAARLFRWVKANPQYHVGHLDWVASVEKEAAKHRGLYLIGAAYRGRPSGLHSSGMESPKRSFVCYLNDLNILDE